MPKQGVFDGCAETERRNIGEARIIKSTSASIGARRVYEASE